MTASGNFKTEDMGYITLDGKLVLERRRGDVILRNGEVIFPASLEALICRCPCARNAVVIASPD
jgi:long-subunit acyl-CoA synthetase (AMP-forming)